MNDTDLLYQNQMLIFTRLGTHLGVEILQIHLPIEKFDEVRTGFGCLDRGSLIIFEDRAVWSEATVGGGTSTTIVKI